MRHTDVAIIGGGLAGSATAAMLGRAGIGAMLVDPHEIYPPDFRCEKLDGSQVAILRRTGLADAILPATTAGSTFWTARFGRLIEKRRDDQNGIMYDDLVNTMRRAIPPQVERIVSTAVHIETSGDRQQVTLANGETVSARLIVLANGLNISLRHLLGIERKVVSPCHSITIGFNMIPAGRASFDFDSLSYYAEHPSDGMAYLTLFPIGDKTRANLFMYRDADDPWLRDIRRNTVDCLHRLMPGLMRITGEFDVEGPLKIRPADLYVTEGHVQAGIVLVGDAFATSCPAGGTGTSKVFTDVERLCNVHIPLWLASDGMSADKIGAFYRDPVKQACDAASTAKAYRLRSISVDEGPIWQAQRWARFAVRAVSGFWRSFKERRSGRPLGPAKSGI